MAEMNVSPGIRISIHVTSDTDGMATREYVKKTAQELSGQMVKQVNGASPDESGNVQVSGLPEGAGAHQQLVTDANGNAVWEDKAFGVEMGENALISIPKMADVLEYYPNDTYQGEVQPVSEFVPFVPGKRYKVSCPEMNWDSWVTADEYDYGSSVVGRLLVNPFDSTITNEQGDTVLSAYLAVYSKASGVYNINCHVGNQERSLYVSEEVEVVIPLPDEFIPNTVPVIQSAQVGQTIVVKAVDDDGKPTEWEAVDIHSTQYDAIFEVDFGEEEEGEITAENLKVLKGDWSSFAAINKARFPIRAMLRVLWYYGCEWCRCIEYSNNMFDCAPEDGYNGAAPEPFVFAFTDPDNYSGKHIEVRVNTDNTVTVTVTAS